MGIDHTTIARRLSALEGALGTRLFDRTSRGVVLTMAGRQLLVHAERVESEIEAAGSALAGGEQSISGRVRLATPEALGTYIIAPQIAAFRACYPDLLLELTPEYRSVSLANREADIAIVVDRPPRGRLLVRKYADYRLGLFASIDYLERHGPVAKLADLHQHSFVAYIDEMIDAPGLLGLREAFAEARPVFRSSSIVAQQAAVDSGAGVGLLHCFAAKRNPALVRLLPDDVNIQRSYWLLARLEQKDTLRIRAVINFMLGLVRRISC